MIYHPISAGELERRRETFGRGQGPSREKVEGLLKSLSTLGRREVFPYEVQNYVMVESGWEQERLYVLTCYFYELEEYDVRIYLSEERKESISYGRCWSMVADVVTEERERLEKEGKSFSWSTHITIFAGIPTPPLKGINLPNFEWSVIINLANLVKRGRAHMSY